MSTNIPKQIKTCEEICAEFKRRFFCYEMKDGEKFPDHVGAEKAAADFIREAMRTATDACTLKEQSIEDNDPAEYVYEIGWNAAVHAQNSLKSSFFGEKK